MKKQIILTESDLKAIVKETVRRVIKENDDKYELPIGNFHKMPEINPSDSKYFSDFVNNMDKREFEDMTVGELIKKFNTHMSRKKTKEPDKKNDKKRGNRKQ